MTISNDELVRLLKHSLESEKKALKELKARELEIAALKNKVRLYERRFEKIRNFVPVKALLKTKNVLKGLK